MKVEYELRIEHPIHGVRFLRFPDEYNLNKEKGFYRRNGWKISEINIINKKG